MRKKPSSNLRRATLRLSGRTHRGVAVLFVLALLSITLSISYAVLRVQTTASLVDLNSHSGGLARHAAMSGMNIALRKMLTNTWGGIGSQTSGKLIDGSSYVVDYIVGDALLKPTDPNYSLLPYRVTLRSKGIAERSDGSAAAEHTIESVVQLVPRAMQTTPANWAKVQSHTVYQWQDQPVTFEYSAQIDGKVHTQGNLSFMEAYPNLRDIGAIRCPFQGYIDEVAIFAKAFSNTDIASIYSEAGVGDPTALYLLNNPVAYWSFNESAGAETAADRMNNHPGVYVSAKPGQSVKPFTTAVGSAFFDGLNDHVQCTNLDVSGSFTVLAWVNPTGLSSDMRIISKATGHSDKEQIWKLSLEQIDALSSNATFAIMGSNNTYYEVQYPLLDLQNTWTFLAGVYDSKTNRIKIYRDGALVSSTSCKVGPPASTAFIMIGDAPPGSPRCRLLHDLYRMKVNNLYDHRPLISTMSWQLPAGKVNATVENLWKDDLKVTPTTVPVDTTAPVAFPLSAASYQLFAGGPVYSIPALASKVEYAQLKPDVLTNPLGIYSCSYDLAIGDNAIIQGCIVLSNSSSSSLYVTKSNVTWTPVNLLPLQGEPVARQLPIAISPAAFAISDGALAIDLRGQIVAGDRFEVLATSGTTQVTLKGSCVSGKFAIWEDKKWPKSGWSTILTEFYTQRTQAGGLPYLPQFLSQKKQISTVPRITITPDNPDRIYHWPNFSQPLYVPHPDDTGLRWTIVRWRDLGA